MDFNKSVYKLCDVKWAVNEDKNMLYPCLKSDTGYSYLTNHSKSLTNTTYTYKQIRLKKVNFKYISSEDIYCLCVKSPKELTVGFYEAPEYNIHQESFLDFCARVYKDFKSRIVTFSDILCLQNKIKEIKNFEDEIDLFNAKTVCLDDIQTLIKEIKNGTCKV